MKLLKIKNGEYVAKLQEWPGEVAIQLIDLSVAGSSGNYNLLGTELTNQWVIMGQVKMARKGSFQEAIDYLLKLEESIGE